MLSEKASWDQDTGTEAEVEYTSVEALIFQSRRRRRHDRRDSGHDKSREKYRAGTHLANDCKRKLVNERVVRPSTAS